MDEVCAGKAAHSRLSVSRQYERERRRAFNPDLDTVAALKKQTLIKGAG